MKVLILNYARQLFEEEGRAIGGDRARMRDYGKYLDMLYIVVHTLKGSHFQTTKISDNVTIIPSKGWNRFSSFYNLMKISSSLCSQFKIDIINAQEPYYMGVIGSYLKKKYGCKLITAVLGANVYDRMWLRERKSNYFKSVVGRSVLKHSDFIQVDGSKTEKELIEEGIPEDKIFKKPIVPKELERFCLGDREGVRKMLLGEKFERILLFVGRIETQKNLKGLLSIMPDIVKFNPKVLLLIIGEGRERAGLQRMVDELGIKENVLFFGSVPYSKIPDYYAGSDIFLLPSNYEGFARSLMEAGISGKAIVSTNVSGTSDLITDGESGFIVEAGDMEGFRDKIIELLQDEEKVKLFGLKVKKSTKKLLDYDNMVESQINFWRFVCGN